MTTPAAAAVLIRSRSYRMLLAIAAIIGVPISAIAYFFLSFVGRLQHWTYVSLPAALGLHGAPIWWPVPPLAVAGLLVGLTIRYLPGAGGHSPADGFSTQGAPGAAQLPGVLLAALATLGLGAVLGPEAPLIAVGGGLAALAVRLLRRDTPATTQVVVAAAGSFAAISALFGSPLLGAFLVMEAIGLGGISLELVLLPGLLAAGVGSVVFIGLDAWTGLGRFSLRIPHLPHVGSPTAAEFAWAVGTGLAAALVGTAIRRLGLLVRAQVEGRLVAATPVAGLVVAGLAIAYAAGTGRSFTEVLFSGQSALPSLVAHAGGYPVGALLLLLCCKGLAYACSLASFRGGPVFPSLFLGAAGGIALAHLPGLTTVAGMAMGIGALCAVMLRLPLTSVLLATLLLYSDGVAVMPLVIVAVVVAYVASARWTPVPEQAAVPGSAAPAAGAAAAASAVPSQAAGQPARSALAGSPAEDDITRARAETLTDSGHPHARAAGLPPGRQ